MSRSRAATGTITAAVLVIVFGNQIVTKWINDTFTGDNVVSWFMHQLTWPNWTLSTSDKSNAALRTLIANDLRALLIIGLVGLLLYFVRKTFPEGFGGFLLGWSILIFASALAAFLTAFAIADPSVLEALSRAANAAVYGFFVGWILGITTSLGKNKG
jgi:hypothetical protein